MRWLSAYSGLVGLALLISAGHGHQISSIQRLELAVTEEDVASIKESQDAVTEILKVNRGYCDKDIDHYETHSGMECGLTIFEFALMQDIDFIVKQCLDQKVNLETSYRSMACFYPLEMAFYKSMGQKGISGRQVNMLRLLRAGANPNHYLAADNGKGFTTLLHLAAEAGDTGMVKLLLDYGADATVTDVKGNTPLHLAVKHCDADLIQELFKASPKQLHAQNFERQTPMETAGKAWEFDKNCQDKIIHFLHDLDKHGYTSAQKEKIKDKYHEEKDKAKTWLKKVIH